MMFQRRSKKTRKRLAISLKVASMGSVVFLFSLYDGYRNMERARELSWFYPFVTTIGIITAFTWIYFIICLKNGNKKVSTATFEN